MLLRVARPEDAPEVARVHVRSWQAGYRGLLPAEYLDSLRPEDRAQHYDFSNRDAGAPTTIVAVDDAMIRGFTTFGRGEDVGAGQLMALYVDPDSWGRGAGRALIDEARSRMRTLGLTFAVLWVLEGNIRAEAFYERDGWIRGGTRRRQRVWGIDVEEIAYTRRLDDR